MERFSAARFFQISEILERLAGAKLQSEQTVIPKDHALYTIFLPSLQKRCDGVGLRQSSKYIARMITELSKGQAKMAEWQKTIPELQHRIHDEMEDSVFMFIPSDRSISYNQPELMGASVNTKFPSIQFDVVEAGNCYACGRGTAAVFHLMRIMEIGVQEFGTALGVALAGEKNWQNILDEVNKKVKDLPRGERTVKICEVSANLFAVKLAWRNEVMHPKDTYTLEEADNLIRQVKLFMQNLVEVV